MTDTAVEKKVKKSLKAKKPKMADAETTATMTKKKKVKPVQEAEGGKVTKKKVKKIKKTLTKKKAKLASKQVDEEVSQVKAPKPLRHVVLADTTLQVKISDNTNTHDSAFAALSARGVSEQSLNAIEEMQDLKCMNDAQHKIVYPLLKGRDLLVRSGSADRGKQLVLLLHAIEIVHKLKMTPQHGTGALFVVPNGEYALQTMSLLKELMENHTQSIGMLVSGKDHKQEVKKLTTGVNILIATPGRLLNHLQNTPQFQHRNLQYLVVTNADEIVQLGLEEEMVKAVGLLRTRRQSVVCTANVQSTESLIKLSLKKLPLFIDLAVSDSAKPEDAAELSYLVCSSKKRLVYLQSILRRSKARKVVVYFSSSMSVQFHEELLEHLDIRSSAIHNLMKQSERSEVFLKFCNDKAGILLCTELAARDFSMPEADMIIHYDQPSGSQVVLDRAVEANDQLLLFLHPHETPFLEDIDLRANEMTMANVTNVESKIVDLLKTLYSLHIAAREAYKGYIASYAAHGLKEVFDVSKLDLEDVAAGFGFAPPPFVELNIHI